RSLVEPLPRLPDWPLPQQRLMLVMVIPQVPWKPAVSLLNWWPPDTDTGTSRLVRVPSPIWPLLLTPQQRAVLSLSRAQLWKPPRVIAVTVSGGAVTVIAVVPLLPSAAAVITALPGDTAVTSPLALTVATAELLLDHSTLRSASTVPLADLATAVTWVVAPTSMLAAAAVSSMVAIGIAVTVTWAVPDTLPACAVIVTGPPGAMPVTTPLDDTEATAELLVDQVVTLMLIGLPWASRGVATRVVVAPVRIEVVPGAIVTDATVGGGGGGGGGGGCGVGLVEPDEQATSRNRSDARCLVGTTVSSTREGIHR